jgi:hypothetical protein
MSPGLFCSLNDDTNNSNKNCKSVSVFTIAITTNTDQHHRHHRHKNILATPSPLLFFYSLPLFHLHTRNFHFPSVKFNFLARRYVNVMGFGDDESFKLVRRSVKLSNSVLGSQLCLEFHPSTLACAIVDMAAKAENIKLPPSSKHSAEPWYNAPFFQNPQCSGHEPSPRALTHRCIVSSHHAQCIHTALLCPPPPLSPHPIAVFCSFHDHSAHIFLVMTIRACV